MFNSDFAFKVEVIDHISLFDVITLVISLIGLAVALWALYQNRRFKKPVVRVDLSRAHITEVDSPIASYFSLLFSVSILSDGPTIVLDDARISIVTLPNKIKQYDVAQLPYPYIVDFYDEETRMPIPTPIVIYEKKTYQLNALASPHDIYWDKEPYSGTGYILKFLLELTFTYGDNQEMVVVKELEGLLVTNTQPQKQKDAISVE